MNLYLLRYNNFYNRILKRLETISEYADYQIGSALTNINFIPEDGINTKVIVNWNDDIPDYMLVEDGDTFTRWFVIESVRTRKGQFELTLRRDVIADNLAAVLDAPIYVNKGYLPMTDPMIFNDEGIQVNQILNDMIELKDGSACPWLVAYIPKYNADTEEASTFSKTVTAVSSKQETNLHYDTIAELKAAVGDGKNYLVGYTAYIFSRYASSEKILKIKDKFIRDYDSTSLTRKTSESSSYFLTSSLPTKDAAFTTFDTYLPSDYALESYDDLADIKEQFDGQIVSIGTSASEYQYYIIDIDMLDIKSREVIPARTSATFLALKRLYNAGTVGNGTIVEVSYKYQPVQLTLTPYYGNTATFTLAGSTRSTLKDQPYDMIAIPYPINVSTKRTIFKIGTSAYYGLDPAAAIGIATNMSKTWGNSFVYDVQLLPYCPVRDILVYDAGGNSYIQVQSTGEGSRYNLIKDTDGHVLGIAFYCIQSSDTFTIAQNISNAESKTDILANKFRLVSPNYSSKYELDVYPNGGIESFNVSFTYLPYQPFIKVNPNFKYLNGLNNNDDRGLILGGNYSITRITDQWSEYVMNNSSYQAIFDRQVKNLKTTQKFSRIESAVSMLGSAIGMGTYAGAAATPLAGIAAGVASASAGAADLVINELKYKEQKSYATDLFNLNNQTIQARPDTIANITAINNTFKYFPYIECFSCTNIEITAIENKLEFNGMTVGRIGTMREFMEYSPSDTQYFQGDIIRLDSLSDDYHMGVEIADTIKQGIYMKEDDI